MISWAFVTPPHISPPAGVSSLFVHFRGIERPFVVDDNVLCKG